MCFAGWWFIDFSILEMLFIFCVHSARSSLILRASWIPEIISCFIRFTGFRLLFSVNDDEIDFEPDRN